MNNQKIPLSKIHFLFSLGHRCNSVNAMKENDIRMCSGPFDYMYIDLEACFQSIQDRFQTFFEPRVYGNQTQTKKTSII